MFTPCKGSIVYKLRFYVALTLIFLTSSLLYSQTIRIALFTPRADSDMFWGPFSDFMREAVNDLGMELTVYYAEGNHLAMQKQVKDAVSSSPKLSVLVVPNFKKVGASIVEIANQAQVPIFIVNNPVDQIGEPRERYNYWIGEMIPDDEDAGFVLANLLFENASFSADGKIHVGEFKNGAPHGQGTRTYLSGAKYAGEFKDGLPNGQGTLTSPDGSKYVGE